MTQSSHPGDDSTGPASASAEEPVPAPKVDVDVVVRLDGATVSWHLTAPIEAAYVVSDDTDGTVASRREVLTGAIAALVDESFTAATAKGAPYVDQPGEMKARMDAVLRRHPMLGMKYAYQADTTHEGKDPAEHTIISVGIADTSPAPGPDDSPDLDIYGGVSPSVRKRLQRDRDDIADRRQALDQARTTLTQAHHDIADTPLRDVTSNLSAVLDTRTIATLAAVDRRTPPRWLAPNGPTPRHAAATRLRVAHLLATTLVPLVGADGTRSWFSTPNPLLDDTTPTAALHDGRTTDVIAALRGYIDGTFAL